MDGGFHKWEYPKNEWSMRKIPLKTDDNQGYPHVRKPPYSEISSGEVHLVDHLVSQVDLRALELASGWFEGKLRENSEP